MAGSEIHSEDPKFCGATGELYSYQVRSARYVELLDG
jgi:hypothetical protein